MMIGFALVVLWVAIATYGDVQFKTASSIWSKAFLIGFLSYVVTSFIAFATFHQQTWGWVIIVWNVLALALGLALSISLYDEPLTGRRIAAAALLTTAIFLAE